MQGKFGVKITYRHLMEELPSLGALAEYIETQTPSENPAAADRGQLNGGRQTLGSVDGVAALEARFAPGNGARGAGQERGVEPTGFGPYHPVRRGGKGGLTPKQSEWLDRFITRYGARTPNSKRFAQQHRRALADPRSVAGFRVLWKELVYQIVVDRGLGARLWDIDENEYIDLTMGFGVNLFGHSPPFVVEAIQEQLKTGVQIGPQSPLAGEVAELICELTGMERATFCNTGSEAVMAALRVARAVTGRSKIAFFTGDYHRMFDEVLLRAGGENGTLRSVPVAPGIPLNAGAEVLILEYGASKSLEILRAHASELAAVLVEPVQSRHPDLQPREFLQELRRWTEQAGVVLIFDEVITGFRVHPGGAQALFGVRADLAAYGKVLGGGLPIGVLAGKGACMDALDGGFWQFGDDSSPEADMTFFAGTFVRHPLALAAARASLLHLKQEGATLQEDLNGRTTEFVKVLNTLLEQQGAPLRLMHFGSLFRFQFSQDWTFAPLLIHLALANGVYLREPNQNCFLSSAHSSGEVERAIDGIMRSVTELQEIELLPRCAGGSASSMDSSFPLSEAQREVWLASQLGLQASCAYNESCSMRFSGPLNVDALRRAYEDLIARHEALRTVFSAQGDWQKCLPASSVNRDLPIDDLSDRPEAERSERTAEILQHEATTPIDLVNGPVVRARLIHWDIDLHYLVFTAHHLVLDGWSSSLVLSDLGKLYSSHCAGHACSLDQATPFREIAGLQAERARSPEAAQDEAWWLEQFAEAVPVLELPSDHPPHTTRVAKCAVERVRLTGEFRQTLKRTGARLGGTLFTLLLSGFNVLLHRLSRQDRIVVGTFAAGQAQHGLENLVGHCVNMLPLRSQVEGALTFRAYLQRINKRLLNAHDHGDYTYGRLVQKLHPAREPGRAPLVQAVFNLNRESGGSAAFHGLEVEVDANPHRFLLFDLFLNVRESSDKLVLDMKYNADRFEAATIERWLDCYRTLLESIVQNPDTPVEALALLSEGERRRILVEWNDTRVEVPGDCCAHELFEAQANRTPHAIALSWGQTRWSYEELDARSSEVAGQLRASGVGPESLVGICVERSPWMIAGILGILKAGGAYVPLDPGYPRDRLAFILSDAGVELLLIEEKTRATFDGQGLKMLALDSLPARASTHRREERAPSAARQARPAHLAYVLYTSGSTGLPKGVAIEHGSVVAFVQWALREFSPQELAGVLASTSICFDLSVFEMFVPLACGGTIVLADNALQLPTLKARDEVTLINTVPSVMRELVRLGAVPPSVRTINLAGETLAPSFVDELYRLPGIRRVLDLYGPTEATTYSTFAPRHAGGPGIIGRPIANTQVYILEASLLPAPIGVPGELFIGGAGLARGYLNRADLTADRFIRNPFSSDPASRLYRTGDLARFRPDGNIEYLGRLDHQVKVRGFRVELGEIEAHLRQHRGVDDAAVVLSQMDDGDKNLIAYVVPSSPVRAFNGNPEDRSFVRELRAHLKGKLPSHMVPGDFVVLESLPRTPNGKVDRRALPTPLSAPCQQSAIEPRTPLETILTEVWREVLGLQQVGVTDDLFELGGHSLSVTRIVARIRERFRVDLPMREIFERPTIAGTAAAVEAMLLEQVQALSEADAQRLVNAGAL